jgi:hypothetical protein
MRFIFILREEYRKYNTDIINAFPSIAAGDDNLAYGSAKR